MTSLVEKIVAVHESLDRAGLPHAFGGALALAWCTQRARATIDIDVNVFVDPDAAAVAEVLAALPEPVSWTGEDVTRLERDGQARIWWDATPVDVFLDTTELHRGAAGRCRREPFGGTEVPFLACADLAVFKAFSSRTRDWADLEEMAAAGSLDVDRVIGVLVRYLGSVDERIDRLRTLPELS